jgi:hypothetical protein
MPCVDELHVGKVATVEIVAGVTSAQTAPVVVRLPLGSVVTHWLLENVVVLTVANLVVFPDTVDALGAPVPPPKTGVFTANVPVVCIVETLSK